MADNRRNAANTGTMWGDQEVVDVTAHQNGPNANASAPMPIAVTGSAPGIVDPASPVGQRTYAPTLAYQPIPGLSESDFMKRYRGDRQAGMAEGLQFGSQYFGGGRTPQQMQGMVGGLMDQYQGMANKGMDDAQFAGMRRQATAGLDQQLNQGLQNLNVQQGASGVRGAAGMAGKQNMIQQGQMARAGLEDQMLAQSVGMKERGMAGLGDMLAGERSGLLSSQLGFGNMYAQDRANAQQQILGNQVMSQAQQDIGDSNVHRDNRSWLEKMMDQKTYTG